MLRALALAALIGSCGATPTPAAPTVSLSGCHRHGAPVVRWYVVGRGHDVWLHSGSAPMMVANSVTTRARSGELPGAWNPDGHTMAVEVRVDGDSDVRTVWATKPC